MKNKKSITILMVAFTLASCQSYKREYLICKATNHLQIRVIRKLSLMK